MISWRDDLLFAIIAGAFFATMYAFGMWGWLHLTNEDGIELFIVSWTLLTTVFFTELRYTNKDD